MMGRNRWAAMCCAMLFLGSASPFDVSAQKRKSETKTAEKAVVVKLEFVSIPAGGFSMGADGPESEPDEKPVHPVTLDGFDIGKYEVTQRQWKSVMGLNPSNFAGCDDCPVEMVSWDDVQMFIGKMNARRDGFFYRLPTEAEWEYACRAGSTDDFFTTSLETGWFEENSEGKTHPVGGKKPNAFGVYDMHGNVWEWCGDYYERNTYPSDAVKNPTGPAKGRTRVIRGGGWRFQAFFARAANRTAFVPSKGFDFIGFRLVRLPNGGR